MAGSGFPASAHDSVPSPPPAPEFPCHPATELEPPEWHTCSVSEHSRNNSSRASASDESRRLFFKRSGKRGTSLESSVIRGSPRAHHSPTRPCIGVCPIEPPKPFNSSPVVFSGKESRYVLISNRIFHFLIATCNLFILTDAWERMLQSDKDF